MEPPQCVTLLSEYSPSYLSFRPSIALSTKPSSTLLLLSAYVESGMSRFIRDTSAVQKVRWVMHCRPIGGMRGIRHATWRTACDWNLFLRAFASFGNPFMGPLTLFCLLFFAVFQAPFREKVGLILKECFSIGQNVDWHHFCYLVCPVVWDGSEVAAYS